jgi:hypothetical protein
MPSNASVKGDVADSGGNQTPHTHAINMAGFGESSSGMVADSAWSPSQTSLRHETHTTEYPKSLTSRTAGQRAYTATAHSIRLPLPSRLPPTTPRNHAPIHILTHSTQRNRHTPFRQNRPCPRQISPTHRTTTGTRSGVRQIRRTPFEHWCQCKVSRNGGELHVGKRLSMLKIANYGHAQRRVWVHRRDRLREDTCRQSPQLEVYGELLHGRRAG